MKFIYKTDTVESANEIKALLESAGIPAFISNKRFAQLRIPLMPFMPHYLGVFIYINSQYNDAIALIEDESHKVSDPVNIREFYRFLENPANKDAVYKAINDLIFRMVAVGIVFALLIYILKGDNQVDRTHENSVWGRRMDGKKEWLRMGKEGKIIPSLYLYF